MFNEYDVVYTKVDLSPQIPKGSRGVVLMIFNNTPNDYEIEFVDEGGETLGVVTVSEIYLEKYLLEN